MQKCLWFQMPGTPTGPENQKFLPWLQNSSHRTTRNDAFVVLPRRISDLMPTQRTQLTPQSIRLDDSPGISGFLLDPQRCRSVHVRCVDTGMARVGNRIFHPDVLLLQTTATGPQRFAGRRSPRRKSTSRIRTGASHRRLIPYFSSQSGRSSPATDHHARSEIHSMASHQSRAMTEPCSGQACSHSDHGAPCSGPRCRNSSKRSGTPFAA